MKIELDLPEKMVKDLREKSVANGQSVGDYATELVRKALREEEELTPAQRQSIDARLTEGLEDFRRGRAYGPFATHGELMACLRGKQKRKRNRSTPG